MPRLSILALTMTLLSGIIGCSQGTDHPGTHPQVAAVHETEGKLSEQDQPDSNALENANSGTLDDATAQVRQKTIAAVNQQLEQLRISPNQPKCRRMPNGFTPIPQALKVGLSIPPFKAAKPAY